ncbi:MAG: YbhB/YbcL family Raf kinase inhibitor-like protein [Planctomycetales bacterium]
MEKIVGKGKPIAYALDGYPIYGYTEPDGSPVKGLDAFNGHTDSEGHYHYHASEKYPYLNGGFHGEVVEKEGQVDPQPRAEPVRPALPPMRDARITKFVETQPGSYKLTYDVRGKSGTVSYVISAGSVAFEFVDPSGRKTTETYSTKENSRSGKGRRPPPPGDERPRGGRKPRREQDSDPAKPPNRKMSDSPNPASSRNSRKQGKLEVSSSSIDSRGMLSIDCTCDGKKQSPAVAWKNAPTGTKTFAISLWHTAPDQEKSYWVVYNIPPDTTSLPQDAEGIGTAGINDRRRAEFDPMCSKGPGLKTYHLTVFALSKELTLPSNQASRANLLAAIKDVTLAEGTLDFQYERKGAE